MLSSRSSTPRPRPVHSNSSSFITYQEEYTSSSEPLWTTPVKGKEREKSSAESTLDIRPRKRRRVSNSSTVARANFDAKRTPLPTSFDHSTHISSSNRGPASDKSMRAYGLCQTCQKCESVVLCARCETATCSICTRTCTLGAVSTPPTPLLCFSATPSPRPTLRQLPGDQTLDNFGEIDLEDLQARLAITTSKASPGNKRRSTGTLSRESEHHGGDERSRWADDSNGGCGRVVCQACAAEDSDSHESTCLDCLDGFGCSVLSESSPYDSLR